MTTSFFPLLITQDRFQDLGSKGFYNQNQNPSILQLKMDPARTIMILN